MIYRFKGKAKFLLNEYETPIYYESAVYQNATAAYEASKSVETRVRKQFRELNAEEAKVLGNAIKIRDDWEDVKEQVLYDVILAKYTQNPVLAKLLLATKQDYLVYGNTMHDNEMGLCLCSICREQPKLNRVGAVTMNVRDVLLSQ